MHLLSVSARLKTTGAELEKMPQKCLPITLIMKAAQQSHLCNWREPSNFTLPLFLFLFLSPLFSFLYFYFFRYVTLCPNSYYFPSCFCPHSFKPLFLHSAIEKLSTCCIRIVTKTTKICHVSSCNVYIKNVLHRK